MQKYLISIIIVSLNSKDSFLKTLNSVLDHNFSNREIIVIDGNSKDGTENEILRAKEKISKTIIEDDDGIYDAMNKGVNIAQGEWIIFMNSGDVFESNNVLEKIFEKDIENVDIVFGNSLIQGNNIKYISESKYFDKKTIIMPFCHQSALTRAQVIKKNLFDKKYKLSADFDFFYKCYLNNLKFFKINQIIAAVKSGGISDLRRQDVFMENINIFRKNKNYNKIIKLYFLKLIEFFKQILKFIFPKIIINFILKNKYKKTLIK